MTTNGTTSAYVEWCSGTTSETRGWRVVDGNGSPISRTYHHHESAAAFLAGYSKVMADVAAETARVAAEREALLDELGTYSWKDAS